GCGLETLDLRKNIYLQKLDCSFNNLSTVDLSRNRRLQSVILKRQTAWGVLDGDERPGILVKLLFPDNRHPKERVLKLDCSRNRLENLDIG
ncbi:leucine-rich repeat domain-containing protein, partial [Bacteroides ovatus]